MEQKLGQHTRGNKGDLKVQRWAFEEEGCHKWRELEIET